METILLSITDQILLIIFTSAVYNIANIQLTAKKTSQTTFYIVLGLRSIDSERNNCGRGAPSKFILAY